ncbi:MAG: sugar transferase [Candidatus Hydrogenedentes bacterium]|nr:sugar transferase [Candidatus Hydrogenedentota bacterium]
MAGVMGWAEAETGVRKEIVLFSADLLALAAAGLAALWLRFGGDVPLVHQVPYLLFLLPLALWRAVMAYIFGLYDFRHRLTFTDHAFGGAGAALCGAGGGYLFFAFIQLYYLPIIEVSRFTIAIDALLLFAWFLASRGAMLRWLRARGYAIRLLVAGAEAGVQRVLAEIREFGPPLLKAECLDIAECDVGSFDWPRYLDHHRPDQVLIVGEGFDSHTLPALLSACDERHIETWLHPGVDLALLTHTRVTSIAGLPLVSLNPTAEPSLYRWLKRAMDIAVAFAGLLLALPLMPVAALFVRWGSPGSVFYSQERVGHGGQLFRMFKLRTMHPNAEAASGPIMSRLDDPRITPAGHFLRRYRIDEVPQFWNIIRGDMSLVGPRPERPEFAAKYEAGHPLYARRFLVRPGLTGLAQIHGRYDTDYAQKLRYDLIYINSMSLATDLRILLSTLRTLLTGAGAL